MAWTDAARAAAAATRKAKGPSKSKQFRVTTVALNKISAKVPLFSRNAPRVKMFNDAIIGRQGKRGYDRLAEKAAKTATMGGFKQTRGAKTKYHGK